MRESEFIHFYFYFFFLLFHLFTHIQPGLILDPDQFIKRYVPELSAAVPEDAGSGNRWEAGVPYYGRSCELVTPPVDE